MDCHDLVKNYLEMVSNMPKTLIRLNNSFLAVFVSEFQRLFGKTSSISLKVQQFSAKGLQKNFYSPGKWYQYFFVPPKSPDMMAYYRLVETELSRLYSPFLAKDQVRGKILDFLSVPNTLGKINKSKLHNIFIFESSAEGKKRAVKQPERVKEVKLNPPIFEKPYAGPFKYFKSKNSRKLSVANNRANDCESGQKAGMTKYSAEATLLSNIGSNAPYVTTGSQTQVGIQRNSKSNSGEPMNSCEGFKFFKSKNSKTSVVNRPARKCSKARSATVKNLDTSDDSDVQYVPHSQKMGMRTKRKDYKNELPRTRKTASRNRPTTSDSMNRWYETTLSSDSSKSYSVESDDDFKPNGSRFRKDSDARVGAFETCDKDPDLARESRSGAVELSGKQVINAHGSQRVTHDRPLDKSLSGFDHLATDLADINQDSSHPAAESMAYEVNDDYSSDDNNHDTGFVSPIIMSQELTMSQDQNTSRDTGGSAMVLGESGFDEILPSSPPHQNTTLVLKEAQQLSKRSLFSAPAPPNDTFIPNLELIRRIGSLEPGEDVSENLSQMSAPIEIISAGVAVDLRMPGAIEAIQRHCKNIMETVNAQKIRTPIAVQLIEPMSTHRDEGESEDAKSIDARQNAPMVVDSYGIAGVFGEIKPHFLQSARDCSKPPNFSNTLNSQRSSAPSTAGESVERKSTPSRHLGSNSLVTLQGKKDLPLKKRRPILSSPKLIISALKTPAPSPKKSTVSSLEEKAGVNSTTKSDKSSGASLEMTNRVTDAAIVEPFEEIAKPCVDSDPTVLRRSSVIRIELRSNQTTAEEFEYLTGRVEASQSIISSGAPDVDNSAVVECPQVSKNYQRVDINQLMSSMNQNGDPKAVYSAIVEKSNHHPQEEHALAAEKHSSASRPVPEEKSSKRKVGCGSESSKVSLRHWQRQANLVKKITLPHISLGFFNDPEMRDARVVIDDLASRSGVTLSEHSSWAGVQMAVEAEANLSLVDQEETSRSVCKSKKVIGATHERLEVGEHQSLKSNLGELTPFKKDLELLETAHSPRSFYSNGVDPDATTPLRSQPESSVHCSQESFLEASIASLTTAEKLTCPPAAEVSWCSPQASDVGSTGSQFPIWWQHEYSTPKSSAPQNELRSDESTQVVISGCQFRNVEALRTQALPQSQHDSSGKLTLDNRPEVMRSSTIRTSLMTKPLLDSRDDYDFLSSFARTLRNPEQ